MLKLDKVYCMDCIEGMRLLEDECVDLCVTDPPYFIEALKEDQSANTIRGSSRNAIFHDEFDHFESLQVFQDFMAGVLFELKRVIRHKGQVYMFMSYHHIDWMIRLIKAIGFRYYKPLIWYKPDTMGVFPNQYGCNYEMMLWFRNNGDTGKVINHIGCGQRDVFVKHSTVKSEREEAGYHPTPKPVSVVRQLIKNSSDEGDVVLDPFMGSGTTAVAAKQVSRRFIGFEMDQKWVDVCDRRLAQRSLLDLSAYMDGTGGGLGEQSSGGY